MRRTLALALALAGATGCRACESEAAPDAGAQPTMPTGMLVPATSEPAPVAPRFDFAARMRVAPKRDAEAVVELAPAPAGDSEEKKAFERNAPGARFLSPDAMGLLHECFARAKPGFDPFRPHFLDAKALVKLEKELSAFAATVSAISTAASARARFEGSDAVRSIVTDDEWRRGRDALVASIDELRRMSVDLAGQGRGLWVLAS